MPSLSLKPTHKPIQAFYDSLAKFEQLGVRHEGAVRSAFQELLDHCASQFHWKLVPEYPIRRKGAVPLRADGALIDDYLLNHGLWEAKDSVDSLENEIKRKFAAGYPKENILFQEPRRAILFQNGQRYYEADLTKPKELVHVLELFLQFAPPAIAEWEKAVDDFKEIVPKLGKQLGKLIHDARQTNPKFTSAFTDFLQLCRSSLNPTLAESAVEEMIIQHLLTERIFRKIFSAADFIQRNVIAQEIEKVISALTSKSFSRDHFLQSLDHFYVAIEQAADTIKDFSEKQKFLNTVYERFFQGFSVKVADTHGIVYTPQPLVNFMVNSVEHLLKTEFGKSLADKDVHILDPFTGTGNFIVNLMRHIPKSALQHKYRQELFCNEVMLLPYYIAAMNIEHEFYDATGKYEPFEGVCLVDTFETVEESQIDFEKLLFNEANAARVERQRKAPIRVLIANPPYNAGQIDENDNNKNRKYPRVDSRVGPAKDFLPTTRTEKENIVLCAPGAGNRQGFGVLVTNLPSSLNLAFEKAQCFPLFVYGEDGKSRTENIPTQAITRFQNFYGDNLIKRNHVFFYCYAVLNHPDYRERYKLNLKRDAFRIPLIAADGTLHGAPEPNKKSDHKPSQKDAAIFHAFADAGEKLADFHINYEKQKEYPLKRIENKEVPLDWRVEKMKLTPDKRSLIYNDFFTLDGIPPEVFDYKLGNRSALDWIIDQYRVTRDDNGLIVSDPNRPDDEEYIVRLIGQVTTVSLETQKIITQLLPLKFD
jgi:predicted helicase